MVKKRILYVESNTDGTVGGSHFSLLFLIEGLNKDIYQPIVGFYQENYLIPRYESAGCKVKILKKIKPINLIKLCINSKIYPKYPFMNICILELLKIFQKAANYILTFLLPSIKCWLIIKREQIDLIHLNNTICRPQEWILASIFTKAKIVAHERGINKTFPAQSIFWARYLDAIVCISNAVKINLLKNGFHEGKLYRIYNALDPGKFVIRKENDDVLMELGIAIEAPVVGIVGNIKEWKGQETVIRAIKQVKNYLPNVILLVVGDVSESDIYYRDRLRDIVKNERLQNNIIFTGPRKDIPDIVNCLSILIHASIEPEPFGRTLLEGMALKKPIISTNIGAPLEIVIHGKTGILVSPKNFYEMATAIIKILSQKNMAEKMGNAGYQRLIKKFNLRKNVALTEKIYESVME